MSLNGSKSEIKAMTSLMAEKLNKKSIIGKAKFHVEDDRFFNEQDGIQDLAVMMATDDANNILSYINSVENDKETKDKVSVLPLLCGSGKSTAITLKIKEVVERNDGTGMIIVTDSKDRLNSLWDADTLNPFISEDDKAFIRSHKNAVTVLTSETYLNAIQKQNMHPVLAMTTQRYFNVLTQKRGKATWKNSEHPISISTSVLFPNVYISFIISTLVDTVA